MFEAVVAAADLRCERICNIFAIFHLVWKIVDSPEALKPWKDFVECFDVSVAFEIVTALVFSEANMLPLYVVITISEANCCHSQFIRV